MGRLIGIGIGWNRVIFEESESASGFEHPIPDSFWILGFAKYNIFNKIKMIVE